MPETNGIRTLDFCYWLSWKYHYIVHDHPPHYNGQKYLECMVYASRNCLQRVKQRMRWIGLHVRTSVQSNKISMVQVKRPDGRGCSYKCDTADGCIIKTIHGSRRHGRPPPALAAPTRLCRRISLVFFIYLAHLDINCYIISHNTYSISWSNAIIAHQC